MTSLLLHFYADTEKELQDYISTLKSKEGDYEDYVDNIDDLPSFLNLPLSAGVEDYRIDCKKQDDGDYWIMQVVVNYSFWAWFQQQDQDDDDTPEKPATSVQLMCTSGLHLELADPTTGKYAYPHKFQQLVP